jgi:cell division protein FtsB
MAANYWTDARLAAQRPAARALTFPQAAPHAGADFAPRAAARRRDLSVPSWVVFCMILLATFAVCATVTMRTRAEMLSAAGEYGQTAAEVEALRGRNAALRLEAERLRADPLAIEAAARERLNMVRPNEVVVPLD